MAWGDYFEHLGPGGQTPLDRMRASGYIYSSNLGFEVGENIAWGTGSLRHPTRDRRGLDGRRRATAPTSSTRTSATPPSASRRTSPTRLANGQGGGIYTQDFGVDHRRLSAVASERP